MPNFILETLPQRIDNWIIFGLWTGHLRYGGHCSWFRSIVVGSGSRAVHYTYPRRNILPRAPIFRLPRAVCSTIFPRMKIPFPRSMRCPPWSLCSLEILWSNCHTICFYVPWTGNTGGIGSIPSYGWSRLNLSFPSTVFCRPFMNLSPKGGGPFGTLWPWYVQCPIPPNIQES